MTHIYLNIIQKKKKKKINYLLILSYKINGVFYMEIFYFVGFFIGKLKIGMRGHEQKILFH